MPGWGEVEYSTDIDLVRNPGDKTMLELLSSFEAQVPTVNVVGESKRKFSVVKVVRTDFFVVDRSQSVLISRFKDVVRQPFEEHLVREYGFIEDFQSVCVELQLLVLVSLGNYLLFFCALSYLVYFHLKFKYLSNRF